MYKTFETDKNHKQLNSMHVLAHIQKVNWPVWIFYRQGAAQLDLL